MVPSPRSAVSTQVASAPVGTHQQPRPLFFRPLLRCGDAFGPRDNTLSLSLLLYFQATPLRCWSLFLLAAMTNWILTLCRHTSIPLHPPTSPYTPSAEPTSIAFCIVAQKPHNSPPSSLSPFQLETRLKIPPIWSSPIHLYDFYAF